MPYSTTLASKIREYLLNNTNRKVEEKRMFGGLAFLVDGKMCINVTGENLMCRFDPGLMKELENKAGYLPMIMKGKALTGYCYVEPAGFKSPADLKFWVNLCLDFNGKAISVKKRG